MDPIIEAIQEHITNGDRPKNFFSAYPTDNARYGIDVWLTDGRMKTHDFHPTDHNQFFEWFKAADQWWKAITNTR
jgi:hypothetical protein